ncbi:MAG: hypothetical protein OHK0038_21150 [Flammeovirgaceae bacterium]
MPLRKFPYFFASVALLVSIYVAGIWGMNSSFAKELLQKFTSLDSFASLTPLNLLLTAFLLFVFQKPKDAKLYFWMLLVMVAGFLVEVLGVHTGLIFGNYAYGEVLGWKLWQVPLLIGVNWWILIHTTCQITFRWTESSFVQIFFPPLLMACIDILIEPIAIKHHFWGWQNNVVPIQNYLAWYFVSLLFSVVYYFLFSKQFSLEYNPMSFPILLAQIVFFGVNNFIK